MTPGEAVTLVRSAGHIVCIHRGEVFFNTTDEKEALRWEEKGAMLVPHYDDEMIANRRKKMKAFKQGWEVHFLGALKRIEIEDVDGDLIDVTKDELLAAAREKVPA